MLNNNHIHSLFGSTIADSQIWKGKKKVGWIHWHKGNKYNINFRIYYFEPTDSMDSLKGKLLLITSILAALANGLDFHLDAEANQLRRWLTGLKASKPQTCFLWGGVRLRQSAILKVPRLLSERLLQRSKSSSSPAAITSLVYIKQHNWAPSQTCILCGTSSEDFKKKVDCIDNCATSQGTFFSLTHCMTNQLAEEAPGLKGIRRKSHLWILYFFWLCQATLVMHNVT